MLNFLTAYFIFNIIIGLLFTIYCWKTKCGRWDMLLLPVLYEVLDIENSPRRWKAFADLFFILFFLPYLIIYYLLLSIYILLSLLVIKTIYKFQKWRRMKEKEEEENKN